MTLEEYEKKVIECISNPECEDVILNNNIQHATILIEQMFKHATQRVRLLSVSLDAALYNKKNVLDAISNFLSTEGTNLEIVTEKNICVKNNAKLLSILNKHKKQVGRRVAEPWLSKQYKYNFLVSDDSTYRFEGDKSKHEATAEFHNQDYALKLNKVFDKIYELAGA